MRVSDQFQRVALAPFANKFRGSFRAAIVYNDNFKIRAIVLSGQGPEALIEWRPIVVDGYDDAE